MDEMVRMQAADGRTIRAPFGLLDRSKVIQEMCRHTRPSSASDNHQDKDMVECLLPLHGIRSTEVLLKLLLWAEYHKGDEEPAWVAKMEPVTAYEMELFVHDWDKEFMREKIEFVFALMEAADYLDIPWLYKLAAYKIALHSRHIRDDGIADDLKQYQERIHAMAMFEWTGETSERALEEVAAEKIAFEVDNHRVHFVVISCAINYPVRSG